MEIINRLLSTIKNIFKYKSKNQIAFDLSKAFFISDLKSHYDEAYFFVYFDGTNQRIIEIKYQRYKHGSPTYASSSEDINQMNTLKTLHGLFINNLGHKLIIDQNGLGCLVVHFI